MLRCERMARPLCFIRRNELLDLTMRTLEGRCLLRPSREINARLLNVLARCLERYDVWLHAFVFMSNHLHMLVTALNALHATSFRRDFKRDTACEIKRVTGWTGDVWARNRAVPVLDDAAAMDRLRYVLANGVKEGLVAHPLEWPGASSTAALLGDMRIVAPATRHAAPPRTIALAPLPGLAARTPGEHRAVMKRVVSDVTAEAAKQRAGMPCLGVHAILATDRFTPIELAKSKAPIAYCSSPEVVAAYKEERDAYTAAFRVATGRLRDAGPSVPFPCGSFVPSLYEE